MTIHRINRTLLTIAALALVMSAMPAYADGNDEPERRDSIKPFILTDIQVVRINVFDTTGGHSSWASDLINALHIVTRDRVIRYEVFFQEGDTITQAKLDEVESNMRALHIFANIRFQMIPDSSEDEPDDEGDLPYGRLLVTTQDNWSTRATLVLNTGGDATLYGVNLWETNLLGHAVALNLGADHSTVNDRGWGFNGSLADPNLYGSHLSLGGSLALSHLSAAVSASFARPYYSDQAPWAFSTTVSTFNGDDFFYFRGPDGTVFEAPETHSTGLSGWYGESRQGKTGDVFRWALRLTYNRTTRDTLGELKRAFENSASAFGGLFSLHRRFVHIRNVDFHGETEAPIGGSGGVSIGYVGPHHGGLDEVVYLGAEVRQAASYSDFYLFATMQAGTGLAGKDPRFTLERSMGSAAMFIGPGVLAARIEQTNIWNWPRYVLQRLDNGSGLRGYPLFGLIGDNKIVANVDYRLFPLISALKLKAGLVAFYDVGAVWTQGEQLATTRFHSSAGIGLRVGSGLGRFEQGLFRLDFAYAFDRRKFAQIIFSTQEAFDVFGTLDYTPPAPFSP